MDWIPIQPVCDWTTLVKPILCYLAHPVGHEPERTENVRLTLQWLRALNARYATQKPPRRFVAPWLAVVASGEPENNREDWLEVDCALVRTFDELWLCGDAEISAGMRREAEAYLPTGRPVFRLTAVDAEPVRVDVRQHDTGFRKNTTGKSRVELLPPSALLQVGHTLRLGADEYGAHNWREAPDEQLYVGAAMRHILRHQAGETLDESGYLALAHAAADLLIAAEILITRGKK